MIILYATTNPGKFNEAKINFAKFGFNINSPQELGIKLKVEEIGTSLEENATLKAEAYLPYVSKDTVVLGDDTGVEIDALGGEPGIKVRRWKGYPMTDEEIINYCMQRMKDVPTGKRSMQFKIAIAVAAINHKTKVFVGRYQTNLRVHPLKYREEGFPFRPLITAEKPMHRIRAIKQVLPYLSKLQSLSL